MAGDGWESRFGVNVISLAEFEGVRKTSGVDAS